MKQTITISAGLVLLMFAPLIVAIIAVSGATATADCADEGPGPTTAGDRTTLTHIQMGDSDAHLSEEQATNATAIAQVVIDELALPRRALEIAIATALQESSLINLDHGDRDSAGLFQQRPSTGWGTLAQVTDPRLATLAFLGVAAHTANPGLLDVPGWQAMPLTQAAQTVQRSAFPDAYARWEATAREIALRLAGEPAASLDAATCDHAETQAAFTIATLNILGAGHTPGPDARPGFATWERRLPAALDAMRSSGATVAGLQEVHDPQQEALASDPTWDVFPRSGKQNVVIWNPTVWTLAEARLVKIPYFHGEPTGMPLVRLTSKTDGRDIWVWSIHNPADVAGNARRHRVEGLRRQAETLEPLVAAGVPVFIVGDFNDLGDGPVRAHCRLTPLLTNAFDNTNDTSGGPCRVPADDAEVDHVFGANITFADAEVDRTVQHTKATDHPLVVAHVAGSTETCPPTASPAERGLSPDALMVLRCVEAEFGPHTYGGIGDRPVNPHSDHPAGRAVDVMIENWDSATGLDEGTRIAAWVRSHATELGVTYIIWRAQIWSTTRAAEDWRPYRHPSGAADPTSAHLDHVHVSVEGSAGTGLRTTGDVEYPVPIALIDADRHNWHDQGTHWSRWHTGTDFSVPCGTPVLAAHAGTIELDRSQRWAGRWLVKVTTGATQLTTWYAHLRSLVVDDGDAVRAGEQIGTVGGDRPTEGNSSGCHLHFEVHLEDGDIYGPDNVDPSRWLADNARDPR